MNLDICFERGEPTPWLGVLTLGGVVAWCGLFAQRADAAAGILTEARRYVALPPPEDPDAWNAFLSLISTEDDGRQALLHYYLGLVPMRYNAESAATTARV